MNDEDRHLPPVKPGLYLWERFQETDPKYTQKNTVEGRPQTSIPGAYVAMELTESFGPCGIGWGFEIISERFDETIPMLDKEGNMICMGLVHTAVIELWYIHEGLRGTIKQPGHTKYRYMSKHGPYCDTEYLKKSITDAMKKCAYLLGVAADVMLGYFEDLDYVEVANAKSKIKHSEDKGKALADQKQELMEWVKTELETYAMVPNAYALKAVHESHMSTLRAKCQLVGQNPEPLMNKFVDRFNKRLEEIKNETKK